MGVVPKGAIARFDSPLYARVLERLSTMEMKTREEGLVEIRGRRCEIRSISLESALVPSSRGEREREDGARNS